MFAPKPVAAPDLTATFSTNEVAGITGLSLRQLQWWDERKLISPSEKINHRRSYGRRELLVIMTVDQLLRKGLSLQKIKRLIRPIQRAAAECLSAGGSEAKLYLATDGATLHVEKRDDRVLERLLAAQRAMYLVCLSDQAQRVASSRAREQSGGAARARKKKSNHAGPVQLSLYNRI